MKTYYICKNNKWVKANKWMRFKASIYRFITRFKIVDSWNYKIIPYNEMKYHFILSPKEYESAQKIYKEKGTISYIFHPGTGIGWVIKVKVSKTDEIIDITDYGTW